MVMPIVAASLPVREVWIEIVDLNDAELLDWSLPVREVWIEISQRPYYEIIMASLPVREVWIEIIIQNDCDSVPNVTSREGSVD